LKLGQKSRHFSVLVIVHDDMRWLLLCVKHILLFVLARRHQVVWPGSVCGWCDPDRSIIAINLQMSVSWSCDGFWGPHWYPTYRGR
jgi:hypothetical protein